jgi:hypothetical protein
VFDILKLHWTPLNKGYKYHEIKVCWEIFICNLLCATQYDVSKMVCEDSPSWLQHGCHLASDGMWLEGPSQPCAPVPVDASLKRLKLEFSCCQTLPSHHLRRI